MKSKLLCLSLASVLLAASNLTWAESCEGDDCEPAPYSLQIITHGESNPRSTNDNPEGRQDNRRVDITVLPQDPAQGDENADDSVRRVDFDIGGTAWISVDPVKLDRQLSVGAASTAVVSNSKPVEPIEFDLKTNYPSFIDRWEVRIWAEGSSIATKPIAIIDAGKVSSSAMVSWNGDSDKANAVRDGVALEYALRVYNKAGAFDQTERSSVFLQSENSRLSKVNDTSISDRVLDDTFGDSPSELSHESIPLYGSTVRVFGMNVDPTHKVSVNGESVSVGEDAKFRTEYLLPLGDHSFDVIISNNKKSSTQTLDVSLDDQYFFMVGLADVMVGQNKVSGSVEPLEVDDAHYGGDLFVDGRLAFYLKGKVKGKYLVTAQMDTGLENVTELFDNFHQKDPSSVFRRLDPDQYYPVYGDDSTIYDDTDSQGKLYVRVEWDRSHVLWGNYNTSFTGAELAPFNRSLYGAQLVYRSVANTELGDTQTTLSAFGSNAQSVFRHNEFLGTGGSLYYLKDTDIVTGSEKVSVEVRQQGSDRVVEKVVLLAGRDYDIDDFQGRIILRRPLTSASPESGPSIIREEPIDGYDTWLVVDYEIIPDSFELDDLTAGVRAKQWLGNHLGIGGTWAHEQRDGQDYDLKAADVTLKHSENTYIQGEFAQTSSNQTNGNFVSNDGGLNFSQINTQPASEGGNAVSVEARLSLQDFVANRKPFDIAAWAKRYERGYSTAAVEAAENTLDAGAELVATLSDRFVFSATTRLYEQENIQRDTNMEAQVDFAATEKLTLSAALSRATEKNLATGDTGEGSLAAAKVAYDFTESTNLYLTRQQTLEHSGSYQKNSSTTVGARVGVSDRLNMNAEYTNGDRGTSTLLGAEWLASDSYSVYGNVKRSTADDTLQDNVFTVGQRKQVSRRLGIYTEHQFAAEPDRDGQSHTIGFDRDINDYTRASASLQSASFEDEAGDVTERDAVSLGVSYKRDRVQASTKAEYRRDERVAEKIQQYVTTNRIEYRRSDSSRWQAKLNASKTSSNVSGENARFIEAGLGYAFRPVLQDRLNLLARLVYLDDLKPLSQATDPDQRSLIASAEGIYDITKAWSTGAKIAHRKSEIRLGRNSGAWLGNDASLAAITLARRVPFGVRASVSYQWLNSQATESVRHGTLLTLGKNVGDHLLFSVGYNFTNFDDNLADDSYDVRGWFVNLVGTY